MYFAIIIGYLGINKYIDKRLPDIFLSVNTMKKIHIISIGGAVMHNIAIQLAAKGNLVTGSDDIVFDPSKSRLEEHGLLPETMGWDASRIHSDLDYVVLGMHAKGDNPELLKAIELGIPIYSFPSFIRHRAQNKRIVVAGSHGKTTTTSMIVHLLKELGQEADYLIGAKIDGLSDVVRFDDRPYFIIEGDEYPSSAIDLQSKFMHYDPHFIILTGIAWDHMNIFPTYESYFSTFENLFASLDPSTTIIYNGLDKEVCRLIEKFPKLRAKPYHIIPYQIQNEEFVLEGGYPLQIVGQHNVSNLTAAIMLCQELGFESEKLFEAATHFGGASRRLQLISENKQSKVYLDFAHAPSKVKASVGAIKEISEGKILVAVLELHTFSSLNSEFLPQYKDALAKADIALVMFDPQIVANKKMKALEFDEIKKAFNRNDLIIINSRTVLEGELQKIFTSLQSKKFNLVFMSSGSFGGLDIKKFIEAKVD
ncbi:UDP-N-acetylmuramate--L-alanine ligase [Membranihabitans marinus]|uniref:UDP-N-acetylmuramate--L-alanine ligase n=1 Tax=Membranihabitans marinus TaxID=1227546 RepID=UPI001EFEFCC0|nr:Mur ligase family protein [Membranihabitans marinus]